MNQRELFFRHVAQTSPSPLAIEIARAEGSLLFGADGKEYIDLIGGISVANTGHRHSVVVDEIIKQTQSYLHVLVYGEMIQSPQVQYAKRLAEFLPEKLSVVYFTNSGAEAVEGAMKLAKRATGRQEILAFNKAYHGSTQGALSIFGDEQWRNPFRPLLPGIVHAGFNDEEVFRLITERTACVVAETVQGEAGVVEPNGNWIKKLRTRCTEMGALLVLDEIQAGFGRTGTLWAFERFGIQPDILLLGKSLGGGLPLGAFISSEKLMSTLAHDPPLGHITTFGGHPLCCAAGLASFNVLQNEKLIEGVERKSKQFLSALQHNRIKNIRSSGLWFAVEFESESITKKVVDACILNGVLTDWFLFAPHCMRISPPLNIPDELIKRACEIILKAINQN